MKIHFWTYAITSAFVLTGCFTGIESTPKISSSEVQRQVSSPENTPETAINSQLIPEPLSQWRKGREYVITNNRISLIFSSSPASLIPQKGDTITYQGYKQLTSIAATENTLLLFLKKGNSTDTLSYRIDRPYAELAERDVVEVPFTVDLSLIEKSRSVLKGADYYILTSSWNSTPEQRITGRKFIKVNIDDVMPGNEEYPISVIFTDSVSRAMVLISHGLSESKRVFSSVFSVTDPKLKYPAISQENWLAIQNGKLRLDMTRDECRLSIGAPKDVDHGRSYSSTYERWTYQNGAYLIFEDGLLKRYRL